MAYGYTALKLTHRLTKNGERMWGEQLNMVAGYGWRLVTIDQDMAVFEREKPSA